MLLLVLCSSGKPAGLLWDTGVVAVRQEPEGCPVLHPAGRVRDGPQPLPAEVQNCVETGLGHKGHKRIIIKDVPGGEHSAQLDMPPRAHSPPTSLSPTTTQGRGLESHGDNGGQLKGPSPLPLPLAVGGHVGPGLGLGHQLQLLRAGQLGVDVVERGAEAEVEGTGREGAGSLPPSPLLSCHVGCAGVLLLSPHHLSGPGEARGIHTFRVSALGSKKPIQIEFGHTCAFCVQQKEKKGTSDTASENAHLQNTIFGPLTPLQTLRWFAPNWLGLVWLGTANRHTTPTLHHCRAHPWPSRNSSWATLTSMPSPD